ncbi:MAG: cupin-like domain-containing protein [Bradymonadia bacterium]
MSDWVLAPEWGHWIDENLSQRAEASDVIAGLVQSGVPEVLAAAEVYRRLTAQMTRRARQAEMILGLQQRMWRTAPGGAIERRSGLSAEAFFAHHYAANRPVILEDFTEGWPALERWSPSFFKSHFGAVEVAVTLDRESDPDYDMRHRDHTRPMAMADYVDALLAAGESNDLYMVANNRNADRPELAPIFDDVRLNHGILRPDRLKGCVALWLGPAGTVTPLHHDTCNIMFCQIRGRKRFKLYPPSERRLLHGARSMYGAIDPEAPGSTDQLVEFEVTVGPGDTLFIPVGWWHHVRALDVSVSIAFSNFARPNLFDDYRPGEVR